MKKQFRLPKLTYTQVIVMSFFCLIITGAFLLCLPISSRTHEWTPFITAMFTATSASCVTGLVVVDTYTHWSVFGQVVVLLLIQIGGLGVMTSMSMIALVLKRRISLGQRRLIMQSAGSLHISGIAKLLHRIIKGTAIVECVGTVILAFVFIPRMGFMPGLWNAVFHSVSAFCNAGFDLMGKYGQFSSLTTPGLQFNPVVILTVVALVLIGGIGFIVWTDIARHRFNFKKYEVHSKIALVTTAVLLVGGTILFFIFEHDHALKGFTFWQKVLSSVFQSVTPRTAGFNSIDEAALSESGKLLSTVLMFIGGSPGSTAGGIKTTTFAVLLLSALAAARGHGGVTVFKRKLDDNTIVQASSIFTVYAACLFTAVLIICAIEPYSFTQVLFESVSAIGTVGLTLGITPTLCSASKLILIMLMFTGRVGGLSLMLVLAERRKNIPISRPTTHILIG
ncbi:MAG: Trk family potassium uptake protein [Firmicutes bacterium HGW-Firmicutes-16]|nr:MAG: Trk family potassium uptake protein [Firmicutes bacterium HGW-Firmicutes-16]